MSLIHFLEGKAKKDFMSWYDKEIVSSRSGQKFVIVCGDFQYLPDSAQYGVIVDWADSSGIPITIIPFWDNLGYIRGYEPVILFDDKREPITLSQNNDVFENIQESRQAAVKELSRIYNDLKQ